MNFRKKHSPFIYLLLAIGIAVVFLIFEKKIQDTSSSGFLKNLSREKTISTVSKEIGDGPAENSEAPENAPGEVSNKTGDLLLPDLFVVPLSDTYVLEIPGEKRTLRFPGVFGNSGDGPLELVGVSDGDIGVTRAVQNIYKKSGGKEEKFVGNFVFHPDHNHWHFENFVQFELWSLQEDGLLGEKLAETGKMTFCLHDFGPLPENYPGKPERAVYPRCISEIQGISVGWQDTYLSEIPGQEIDITGLSDGRYAFVSIVDPENRIQEKNEENNSSVSEIEISGRNVRVLKTQEQR